MPNRVRRAWLLAAIAAGTGCAGRGGGEGPAPEARPDSSVESPGPGASGAFASHQPALPPELAHLAGLLPLRSTGVEAFLRRWPTFDGRGVLIAILDGGVDPGVPGLERTSTGERKIIDIRDFSGEGRVELKKVSPGPDGSIQIGANRVMGAGRLRRLGLPPYYAGLLHERSLGSGPSADLNADGDDEDSYLVVVAKASDGWVLMTDTDGDGSLEDENAVRDYSVAGDVFGYGTRPMTLAVNLVESGGEPVLDLVFDNSSHGTHVAGIAAGHDLFGVAGFNGVAPGAQILALKIASNARGKISVTGSMWRAMQYAARFASARRMPLVINLSYGVGNESEGAAVIDSLVAEFALAHPEVLVVVSAGNDGPGLSTILFPASSDLALSVCALFPGTFVRPPEPGVMPARDLVGWWSARGGEVSKPDLCAPGVAFSNVPRWRTGEEISAGTSMAAPYVSGVAALLHSAMLQEGRRVGAAELKGALLASARPLEGNSVLDVGSGAVDVEEAYRWLRAGHQAGRYLIRALPDGANSSRSSAAYRRNGLGSAADTVQRFTILPLERQPAARLLTFSDAPWLRGPDTIELAGGPVTVTLTYDAAQLAAPGVYIGSLWARPASDTLAGWALRLTNTVIVPHRLDVPLETRGWLAPGSVARYFLAVPQGAGGLEVAAELTAGSRATLSVYEPSGQPARGGGRAELDAQGSPEAKITVEAQDLVPGTYEVTLTSAPQEGVRYRLRAMLAPVAVASIGPGSSVRLTNSSERAVAVDVAGGLVGFGRRFAVQSDRRAETIRIRLPDWAAEALFEVEVPAAIWNRVTDFGVTFFDSSGRKIGESPLNYARGRYGIALDSNLAGSEIAVELFPGFALEGDRNGLEWRADLTVTLKLGEAVPLEVRFPTSGADSLAVPPEGELVLGFDWPTLEAMELPSGFDPVLEVAATPRDGSLPVSVRRALLKGPRR
ncbi:Extracellular basic protease [bacterium HR33]|nr:Extracellular basic protease [bacterium HR33]